MLIGTQLHAPSGFASLARDKAYHFLRNDPLTLRVALVSFGAPANVSDDEQPCGRSRMPEVVFLQRDSFEQAVQQGLIRRCAIQRELPHWFGRITITQLQLHGQGDSQRRRPHHERMAQQLAHLRPALDRLDEILDAESPSAVLNDLARQSQPPQNLARYRTAFFAYVCFGMNPWALHYPIGQIGAWDRRVHAKKFGRPSVLGAQHGHSSCDDQILAMCEEGYRRFCGPRKTLRAIYRQTMINVFGCVVGTDASGRKTFVQPQGKPIVTEVQFAYRIRQLIPLGTRQIIKYGEARTRNRLRVSEGRFSDAVGHLMEMVEADAYFVDSVARGFDPRAEAPRLVVVRIKCVASGMVTGIGFSVRGEVAEAYRNAKACQAVDKAWYCSLYGIEITDEQWPSIGLSLHEISDRGPGATDGAHARVEALRASIREVTPSWSGQSKATVETSHPKTIRLEGAPTYERSSLTLTQLAVREIWRVIAHNQTTNVESRLTVAMVKAGVLPTPIAVWNFLSRIGRTHAYRIPRDEAVRSFFTAVDLRFEDGSFYLGSARYWSPALRDSSLLRRAATGNMPRVQGYALEVCMRHLFLDTPEGLLKVDLMFGIRDHVGALYLSAVELEQLERLRRKQRAELLVHQQAAAAEVAQRFEEQLGRPFEEEVLRAGRPKRHSKISIEEAREFISAFRSGRKKA